MRVLLRLICISVAIVFLCVPLALAQSGRERQGAGKTKKNQPTATPTQTSSPPAEPPIQDIETVKVDTNLVTVPVIASDRNDIYATDLQQTDFSIEEDGVPQEIAFFATTSQPFHVVLMLDTSGSTQEKLSQLQNAATAFVNQLQPGDRVKLISFDDEIRDYGPFTNDRGLLRAMIGLMRAGQGTKLYDAMRQALTALQPIEGRKAIVIFTDGVDWHSDRESSDSNLRDMEEAGVIVYPIRYDTRPETERIARQQQGQGQRVDLGGILGKGTSTRTTPPAVPGGSIPLPGQGGTSPSIPIILPRRSDPNDRNQRTNDPNAQPGNPNDPTRPNTGGVGDNVDAMLDMAYNTADGYLNDIAIVTGGRLHRADTLGSLPTAFSKIAAELRTQYSIGYYPTNKAHDGEFRKIKVRTSRKGVIVRARPGYRAR